MFYQIKKMILVATLLFSGVAQAASINQSFSDGSSSPDLGVIRGSGLVEGSTAQVSVGDYISFSLNYNLNEGPAAQNLRAYLEDIRGKVFKAGSSKRVTGRITSSNYDNSNGAVNLSFAQDIKFEYIRASWQKQTCSSFGCESPLLGSGLSVLSSSGLSLGNVSNTNDYYKGGLVVQFRAVAAPVAAPKNCSFHGQTVNHGASVTAYGQSSVSYGQTCQSQTRTCNNGTLSGTYTHVSCSVAGANNCSFNGQSVGHGSSVTAYQSAAVSYGQTCQSQTRTCNNGVLSGSYMHTACNAGNAQNCSFNGQSISHGSSVTAYGQSSVSYGQTCQVQTRVCNNGVLSGSYQYINCSRGSAQNCRLDGVTVNHGTSKTFYRSTETDQSCSSVGQVRVCDNGNLSGSDSYRHSRCRIVRPTYKDCALDGHVVLHNTEKIFYSSSESYSSCSSISQVRRCIDGNLSGSNQFVFGSCATKQKSYKNCTVNGMVVAHGNSMTLYSKQQSSSSCNGLRQMRSCNNGVLSGSSAYKYVSCQVVVAKTKPTYVRQPKPVAPKPVQKKSELRVTKWVSSENRPTFKTQTNARAGETVFYKVLVENNTGRDLDDVEVIDRIPYYVELDSHQSSNDDEDKQIRWVIDLDQGESRTFVTEMRVREDARLGDVIDSYASARSGSFKHQSNEVDIEVVESHYGGSTGSYEDGDREYRETVVYENNRYGSWDWWWLIILIIIFLILRWLWKQYQQQQEQKLMIAKLRAEHEQRNKH